MSHQGNRVYGFYNSQCGLGPEYFIPYLKGEVCPQKKIELYYRFSISPSDPTINASLTDFVTDPVIGTYRGIANLYMTESDYVTYNQNILSVVAYRTPKNTSLPANLQVPDIYNETYNINIPPYDQNYIQAVANYLDPGSSAQTEISSLNLGVTAAGGIFKGFTNMRIDYYNNGNPPGYSGLGPVRKVTIT